MKKLIYPLLMLMLSLQVQAASLTIEITQGAEGALPIAVVPFAWRGDAGSPPAHEIGAIVGADLLRSGRFKPLPESQMLSKPSRGEEVDFRDWRAVNVENLVIGEVSPNGPGGYLVKFYLYDVFRGEQITGYSMPTTAADLRATAHHIADIVYETLTGQPGAFATRIAYVESLRSGADIDGTLLQMQAHAAPACVSVMEPTKSPYWSYRLNDDSRLVPLLDPMYSRMRRQDLPQSYTLNGAVYAARVDWLLQHQNCLSEQTVAYVMPAERSVDIDTAFDLRLAELCLQH